MLLIVWRVFRIWDTLELLCLASNNVYVELLSLWNDIRNVPVASCAMKQISNFACWTLKMCFFRSSSNCLAIRIPSHQKCRHIKTIKKSSEVAHFYRSNEINKNFSRFWFEMTLEFIVVNGFWKTVTSEQWPNQLFYTIWWIRNSLTCFFQRKMLLLSDTSWKWKGTNLKQPETCTRCVKLLVPTVWLKEIINPEFPNDFRNIRT